MNISLRVMLIFFLWWLFGGMNEAVAAEKSQTGIVQLDSGPIAGEVDNEIQVFRGIPYAMPPVGSLRWKPPQPPQAWTSVRQCHQFGPSCPQPKESSSTVYNEDCLYLNVWAPEIRHQAKLPVMVWIHGGAFNFGGASLPEYEGKNLAAQGVVVVTINYRLGPLGFFAHPLLNEESGKGVSGNYGLLDQIAALQWVQRNIAAFNGDSAQVTIFGQSAGSRSVSLLLLSPLSQGLFKGAIAESGGPIIGSEFLSPSFNGDKKNVERMGQELAQRLGCAQADDVLAALRVQPAEEIVKAAACSTGLFDDGLFFAPVFDGWVLPENPHRALREGHIQAVPVITGSTGNEGALYLTQESSLTRLHYQKYFDSRFGEFSTQAMQVFTALTQEEIGPAIDKVITVGANAYPARLTAQAIEQKGSNAYLYHFTRIPKTALASKAGAHHGVELAYVFGNMKKEDCYNEVDQRLSQYMMRYWVNFAKTGNPNGEGLPKWPLYKAAEDLTLDLGDPIIVKQHLFQKEIQFIETIMSAKNSIEEESW